MLVPLVNWVGDNIVQAVNERQAEILIKFIGTLATWKEIVGVWVGGDQRIKEVKISPKLST